MKEIEPITILMLITAVVIIIGFTVISVVHWQNKETLVLYIIYDGMSRSNTTIQVDGETVWNIVPKPELGDRPYKKTMEVSKGAHVVSVSDKYAKDGMKKTRSLNIYEKHYIIIRISSDDIIIEESIKEPGYKT